LLRWVRTGAAVRIRHWWMPVSAPWMLLGPRWFRKAAVRGARGRCCGFQIISGCTFRGSNAAGACCGTDLPCGQSSVLVLVSIT
jgi:hypothetical protein